MGTLLERAFRWAYYRFRPREGWPALLLLLTLVGLLAWSVASARWVPEIGVVYRAALVGTLLAAVLARRPLRARWAWLLIISYGVILVLLWLSRGISLSLILLGPEGAAAMIRQDLLLLWVRFSGWVDAVLTGRRTTETVAFAIGAGWLTWLLAAAAAWSVFRTRRPLQALTVLGAALAVNNYFAGLSLWYGVAFVGLAILLVSLLNYANLQEQWEQHAIDYSDELRVELVTAAAVAALLLMLLAAVVPAVPYGDIARAFAGSAAVTQVEQGLEQSLAGVRPPAVGRGDEGDLTGNDRPGVMPRSFLIGNPPALAETEVMRARVSGEVPAGLHWRGVTVDTYNRTGWRVDAESEVRRIPAGAPVGLELPGPRAEIRQEIQWTGPTVPGIRYVLGMPLVFDDAVDIVTRSGGDLVQVVGQSRAYAGVGSVPQPTAAQLRAVTMTGVPPALRERYTALPASVPSRVRDLARQVAGDQPTPYDQALALEQFLRQYRYSLEESRLPPPGQDPVDFFLFDLRVGYCDYYASAMVVMARVLGLPARFATGYTQQPVNDAGEQVILQLNAHSWAEIYFPDHGWIEFEPTAGFASSGAAPATEAEGGAVVVPLPEPAGSFLEQAWPGLLLLALLLGLVAVAVRRERPWHAEARKMPELWAYGRLQEAAGRLGRPGRAAETPHEFGRALRHRVAEMARTEEGRLRRGWEERLRRVDAGVEEIVGQYARRRYDRPEEKEEPSAPARRTWRRIRGPLWRLWLRWKLRR